jgi:hypothetical protein
MMSVDRPRLESATVTENEPNANPTSRSAAVRRIQLVRLVGSCLALLISAVFCQQFSSYQLHNFVYGAGFPPSHIPLSCQWFAAYSSWLLVLPPLILMVGARRLVREKIASVTVEVLLVVTLLLALTLIVGCILIWQVPYLMPAGEFF